MKRHLGTVLTAWSGNRCVCEIEIDPYRDGRSVRAVKKDMKRHFPRVTRRNIRLIDDQIEIKKGLRFGA